MYSLGNRSIVRIARAYGLEPERYLMPNKGYRNESYPIVLKGGKCVNLLIYKSEANILDKINNANAVSNTLARQPFPARQTYDYRILRLDYVGRTKYAALYYYLPGSTIPWEAYTKDHLKLLGKTMSDMHAYLSNVSVGLMEVTDVCIKLLNQMDIYFSRSGVTNSLRRKLGLQCHPSIIKLFASVMSSCKTLPNQQVLHMDFVRGNVLFGHEKGNLIISGVLDFEKTSYGHPVFDISRTLAFLLVDCKYKSEPKIRKYFLQSGYVKRGRSSFKNKVIPDNEDKINLLETLINFFLLYDLYKFLRHNPYEFLAQNEHFTRTRDLLLKREVIMNTDDRIDNTSWEQI